LELLEERKKRQSEKGAEQFIPNGKQGDFISQVGTNETFVNLFVAANGVGKSCVGAMTCRAICFGPPSPYFKYPLFEKFPYLKKGRIISDPTTLKEKIIPELKKWFPPNRYTERYYTRKESKNYEAKWVTDTGFEFDLMSNEQDPKEFESVDLGWVWMDEPSKKAIYMGTIARMRQGGILFWTMTPLTYSAWIKNDLCDKRDGKFIDYVTADVEDNCVTHGVRGILTHDNIDKMLSQYPENELEARARGRFGHLLGLVHKGFDPRVHVIEPFDLDKSEYTVYMALDTHPRVPDAVNWMAVDAKGQKYVVDELAFTGTDVEIATKIKKKEEYWNMKQRLIDPSAFNDDKRTTEMCYADRLAKHGLSFRKGSKKMMEGIRKLDNELKYQMKDGQMIVQPGIFIFSNCVRTVKELQNYVWDEYVGKGADEKDPKAKPKDKDDHFVENLHRLVLEQSFIHVPPVLTKKPKSMLSKKYKPRSLSTIKWK
jgi:hypothetical protein